MSVSYRASTPVAGLNRVQTIAVSTMRSSAPSTNRLYRLVDQQGEPHPVLDDLYDSLDTAWADAQSWWREHVAADHSPVGIGVEVSTASGGWRTLRHPGG
ncbi:MAG: hypothetical protein WAM11_10645 [Cyanobium sp.]